MPNIKNKFLSVFQTETSYIFHKNSKSSLVAPPKRQRLALPVGFFGIDSADPEQSPIPHCILYDNYTMCCRMGSGPRRVCSTDVAVASLNFVI